MAALEYRASRLVRATDAKTGRRTGFGERGTQEVVSARWVAGQSYDIEKAVSDLMTGFALPSLFMYHKVVENYLQTCMVRMPQGERPQ